MVEPILKIENLNKYYQLGENRLHILKNINLSINKGEFVSIMGPSGSGKSTLINVLGFLDNQFEGSYLFKGKSLEQRTDKQISYLRNKVVGFIFQDFNLLPSLSVQDNIRLPLLYSGLSRHETQERVEEALAKVGLENKALHRPSELSGGQKQRVAIARALINQPDFIIADEPTGALDTKTSKAIMDILEKLHREDGVTIVMVTHDPALQKYADKHVVIVDGRISTVDKVLNAEELAQKFNALSQASDQGED
ncbi:ABC transporter ATP-binding protein [Vaginisenegalia massiliensis]|uniref:ABC transporter ATP-binding protein n=1 Tax=Vaginisenegalia massiliensis TaxID=2058294 RepID=UPI000F538EA5|nr:ABC transporter ATP-binding protein [Vaginisenegalia massiliensis]